MPRARLRIAQLIVDHGWPVARAAERFQVAWPTAKRWADRYRQLGAAGMQDRSSRSLRQPTHTPAGGPPDCAAALEAPTGTRRHRLAGEPVRRYEHERPGDLLHMDVKKLGNIPDGGGHRFVGRQQGHKHRQQTPGKHHGELMQHAFVHTVIDDHSRVAYAEIHDDETALTAAGVLRGR